MHHGDWINGLCLTCHKVCYYCNQCKCEIGRKKVCPSFDVRKNPQKFEEWKKDREQERRDFLEEKFGRARTTDTFADLYGRRDADGTSYYDR